MFTLEFNVLWPSLLIYKPSLSDPLEDADYLNRVLIAPRSPPYKY